MKKWLLLLLLPLTMYSAQKSYAIAINGNIKYKEGFQHFNYANPNAPKGGELKRYSLGSFDSLNPFILKGVSASGTSMIYDTLMKKGDDEPFTLYALVAKYIELDENRKWVRFHLDERAKFSNNKSILASDVKFTFDTLINKGAPIYKKYYHDIGEVKVISKRVVEFALKDPNNDELPLILAELPVFSKHYWEKRDFARSSLEAPIGSGAYKIGTLKAGKYITYERDKNYWAKDLNVNKGAYNFDTIKFTYYKDESVALEAFKSGEYDFQAEYTASKWANSYTGKYFDKKWIIKEEIKHSQPQGMQGFAFNLRKEIFQDKRVRQALTYAFDFEWANKNLFFEQYTRTTSYFENSALKATGLPSKEELAYLNKLKASVPEEVFKQEFSLPINKGDGNIRGLLRKSTKLLHEAGYEIKNQKLIHKKTKKPFVFEVLIFQEGFLKIYLPFKKNLARLGIDMQIKRVDVAQYINRLRAFDYDMITTSYSQSNWLGNERREYWHSSSANKTGSQNYIGIKDPAVDTLVEELIANQKQQEVIAKALDRVLLHNYYMIPNWHIAKHRIAHWKHLQRPSTAPQSGYDTDYWWVDETVQIELDNQLKH